ncbi:hypothetical protein ACIF80_16795 [Streptomyces sp. NPDC085927]|uniref:hypothetical protein n=1 Tax=Streptomyces sp. NPDC085927 TaxID=3365738 RepID=UPI0037D4178B
MTATATIEEVVCLRSVTSEPDSPLGPGGTTVEAGAGNRIAVRITILVDGSQAPFRGTAKESAPCRPGKDATAVNAAQCPAAAAPAGPRPTTIGSGSRTTADPHEAHVRLPLVDDPSYDDFHNWKPPIWGEAPGGHISHAFIDHPAAWPPDIGAC